MKIALYRILEKRTVLPRVILILGLLVFCSSATLFLPQIGNPHVLAKYFEGYKNQFSLRIEDKASYTIETSYDYSFSVSIQSPKVLIGFDNLVSQCSQEVYGIADIVANTIGVTNNFYVDYSTNGTLNKLTVFGVSNLLYQQLESVVGESVEEIGAIYLCNDSISQIDLDLTAVQDLTFNITLTCNIANFGDFYGNYSFFTDYFDNDGMLFLPYEEYISLLGELHTDGFGFSGALMFSDYQKDIMYWSIDSISLGKAFERKLFNRIKRIDPLSSFVNHPGNRILLEAENNARFVAEIFSLIQATQILLWAILAFLVGSTLIKDCKRNQQKELRQLISGKSWKERIPLLFLDSFIFAIPSALLSVGLLTLFILIQREMLGVGFTLTKEAITAVGILLAIFTVVTFVVRLDFEFYLRRLLTSKESSDSYRFLGWLKRGYQALLFVVCTAGILFLYSKNLSVAGYLLLYTTPSILIGLAGALILISLYVFIQRLLIRRAKKHSKALTAFQLLLQTWRKKFSKKTIMNMIVFSILCSTLILISITADNTKSNYLSFHGSFVRFSFNNFSFEQEPAISELLTNNSQIENFVSVVRLSPISTNESFIQNLTVPYDTLYLVGIDFAAYLSFYEGWSKSNWLSSGSLVGLSNQSCFVSKAFTDYNISLGMSLTLNNSKSMEIKGILSNWQNIEASFYSQFKILMDKQLLEEQLATLSGNFSIDSEYYLDISEKNILPVVDYLDSVLNSFDSFDQIDAFDPKVLVGTKLVHQNIIYYFAQLLIVIFVVSALQTNIVGIHNHPDNRTLGFFAMHFDHRKLLLRYRVMEVALNSLASVIVVTALYIIGYLIYLSNNFEENIALFPSPSQQTILNLLLVLGLFPLLLLIKTAIEFYYQRQLKLSLLYRHPE